MSLEKQLTVNQLKTRVATMHFKKVITVTSIVMAVSGFPISEKIKEKFIFKIIFLLQIYGIFGRFYEIYLERRDVPEERVNVGIHMQYMIFCVPNAFCLYLVFFVRHFQAEIIVLVDKLNQAFAEMEGPSSVRFLKRVLRHQNFWCFILFASSVVNFASFMQRMIDGQEITVRFINQSITIFNFVLLFGVVMLMIFVMMSLAFLFQNLTTFEIKHDFGRLIRLIKMHRKCVEIALLSNRIFESFVLVQLICNIFPLIGFIAFFALRKWHLFPGGFVAAAAWTVVYLIIFVCVSLLSANVNNKLNASIEYILRVASSFESPIFTTKKSFALMTKVDLYVTHVTLSGCYMSNGGLIEIKNKHVITMLGFILSYVVLLLVKSTKEQNI